MAATSSYKTFLMKGTAGTGSTVTWEKLVSIKDYSDLGGSPELLETTTLDVPMRTYILGIQENEAKTFTLNYESAVYDTLKALEGTELNLAVWFGGTESGGVVTPTGSDGKFSFKGFLSIYVNGKGVNEVREMTLTIAASTPIVKDSGT